MDIMEILYTYEVGEVSNTIKDLLIRTKESLYKGIEQAVSGNRIGDIGFKLFKIM